MYTNYAYTISNGMLFVEESLLCSFLWLNLQISSHKSSLGTAHSSACCDLCCVTVLSGPSDHTSVS